MRNAASDIGLEIRPLSDDDSIAELTALLHRAYKPLGEMGLKFFATHQSEDDTLERVRRGRCFVGMCDGKIVATITLYRSRNRESDHEPGDASDRANEGPDWYRRDDVGYFGQFAVDPEYQRRGLGNMLLAHAESSARDDGIVELALDTAETATHLIEYYERHGYRFVEHVQWNVTNYRSVVMSKCVSANTATGVGA